MDNSKFLSGFIIGTIIGAIYGLFKGPRISLRNTHKEGVIGILPANTVQDSIEAGKKLAKDRFRAD
jgi:gas vesicle protein